MAQSILSSSNFKVFLLVTGHSASNGFNARELNPHIMGKGLDKEVGTRYFCAAPVCLGEYVGKELRFDLEQNMRRFFLMAMKRFDKAFITDEEMLHPLEVFVSPSPAPMEGRLSGHVRPARQKDAGLCPSRRRWCAQEIGP